jgi:hypothetical protein
MGVKDMNKRVVIGSVLVLSLAFVVLAASVNTALAVTTYTEHENAGGASIIDVPGHTNIMLSVDHFDTGDFYCGSADRITIAVSAGESGIGPPFRAVAAYEDNPTRIAFSQQLATGVVQNLVKRGQIQVFRIGKTVFAYWTIPLVMPEETWPDGKVTPAVTLPPGLLVLRGYDESKYSITPSLPIGTTGWKVMAETTSYYWAHATLFCPRWHYWGPVAEAITQPGGPSAVTDRTYTWAHA